MHEVHRALSSMRNGVILSLLIALLVGCNEDHTSLKVEDQQSELSTLEKSELKDYEHIKLDLYQDSLNVIYHRTIDVSSMEGDGYYHYANYARVRNNSNEDYICVQLCELIDTASFRQANCASTDERRKCFEDNRYRYSLYSVTEGGILDAYPKD